MASFNKTVQFITSVKLQELDRQYKAFQTHANVLEEAHRLGDNQIARVELLLKAMRTWSGALSNKVIKGELDLDNLELWLRQARRDPGFEKENLRRWVDTLETHIRQTFRRFDCARLFGNLFHEWLSSGDSVVAKSTIPDAAGAEKGSETDFVDVGRKEKHEQKERFMSFVFQERKVDTDALHSYLTDIFTGKDASKTLKQTRENMKLFCENILDQKLDYSTLSNTINGLLAESGSLSDEGVATLREFLGNTSIMTELTSVLNMRLASIETWSWPAEGIPVQMRRHLNGKYRAFTDPDIIDSLLFHYLGLVWQVKLKELFTAIFNSKTWKTTISSTPDKEQERLRRQFNYDSQNGIESYRHRVFQSDFFLCTLSGTMSEVAAYDGGDAETQVTDEVQAKSPARTKQKLLHTVATECQLNKRLHAKHAVICSDFEWFGPSLSHESILTVFKFFGVTNKWLNFFKKFLAAPLRFTDEGGSGEVRVRKRGTPFSYTLSTACGEVVMFIMDFAINQRADGIRLYRMHDDLWLFDADASKCARAWKEMNTYANLVGLTFNKEKTGSACVGGGQNSVSDLPDGDVKWGFLKFDQVKGRFAIDQAQVDLHIVELRRQLAATKSIIGWVNAYNKYMAFLLRNFGGHPAQCFGRDHLNDLLDTFSRIQRELFKDFGSNSAVNYLRGVIQQRFNISDLPEGYFYFPVNTGGLELKNPFVELCSVFEDTDKISAEKTLRKRLEIFESETSDEEVYETYKKEWEKRKSASYLLSTLEEFMSYDEFLSLRGIWIREWATMYGAAFWERPREIACATPMINAAIQSAKYGSGQFTALSWYEKWLVALYGDQLVEKFGALEIVDSNLIPLGLVELFQNSRIKLDE
ncbi:hypothetical protein AMATHDRAFT_53860 [Amanita thiersii Skay4041]|uniref:Reverse transcriptase domain-containing protein n=1 Tax=Amanita thiersii Skay4041 TaxID=703135 RepID=A0A2A9NZM7_9AGAR|nr:hypothetical protein AMATHDRAFT_53860 [Amanita thiersii Skay4041]